MIKTIKIVSKHGVSNEVLEQIKDIYETSVNPNQIMLDTLPYYQFAQGDVLYFTDLREKSPTIQEIQVEEYE